MNERDTPVISRASLMHRKRGAVISFAISDHCYVGTQKDRQQSEMISEVSSTNCIESTISAKKMGSQFRKGILVIKSNGFSSICEMGISGS